MAERRGFAEWEGLPVAVQLTSGSMEFGTLEEVNNMGIVLRHSIEIGWPTGAYDDYGSPLGQSDTREVSKFFPWNNIASVRPLEPEEIQAYDL